MRSGSTHLKKRVPERERISQFEYRGPREVVLPEPAAEAAPSIDCELDRPHWSVVSFNQVEAGGLTYRQAAKLVAELEASGLAGLCLTTDDAARKALLR